MSAEKFIGKYFQTREQALEASYGEDRPKVAYFGYWQGHEIIEYDLVLTLFDWTFKRR